MLRAFTRAILAAVLLGLSLPASAETPTVNSRLPLQQDGPLTVSPWFLAAQPQNSAEKNHYMFSEPPFYYFGFWSYSNLGYGYGWYAPVWGYPAGPAPFRYYYGRW